MPLNHQCGVAVESFVEMEDDVPMRYEVDRLNEHVTLHCGQHSEYVLTLSRTNLAQFVALANEATAALNADQVGG